VDELVKLVSKKAGITQAQAKQAVEAVVGFLKKKLPKPIGGQIDAAISGIKVDALDKQIDNVTKGLGGLLGKGKKK